MTYIPMGEISTADFNATKFPGVCKPTNKATLDIYFELQRQLNRVAKVKGLPLISVDGDIGPGTLRLVNASGVSSGAKECQGVALVADMLAAKAKGMADAAGAPTTVAGPSPARSPSILNLATGTETQFPPPPGSASLADAFKNLGTPMIAALAVGVLGIGYLLLRKPKPKAAGTP